MRDQAVRIELVREIEQESVFEEMLKEAEKKLIEGQSTKVN